MAKIFGLRFKGKNKGVSPHNKAMALVNQILGKGAVADLCLWKDTKKSGTTLVLATLFWFLFEVMETRFVPLLCSILLLLMLLLFLWAKFGELIFTRRPPTPEEIKLEDSQLRTIFKVMEGFVLTIYEIAYGKDIKTFIKTVMYVAIIDAIGSYINLLTILYTCLVCAMIIPVWYLQYQEGIDSFIGNLSGEKNKLLQVFNSNVLNKIPRSIKKD